MHKSPTYKHTHTYTHLNVPGDTYYMHECTVVAQSHLHTLKVSHSHTTVLGSVSLQHFCSVPRVPGLHRTVSSKEQTFVPVTLSL